MLVLYWKNNLFAYFFFINHLYWSFVQAAIIHYGSIHATIWLH